MSLFQFSSVFRKSLSTLLSQNIGLAGTSRAIHMSPCLAAEPLKKKKRLDPAIVKAREERRKKKMEKAIRRLEKNQRQLKPIDEVEVPFELIDQKGKRQRNMKLSPEKLEEFAVLQKEWSRHMLRQHNADADNLERIAESQLKALEQLRLESEDLYQAAVKIDEKLLPFKYSGPTDTPPIEKYNSPDGEYTDISKKWQ